MRTGSPHKSDISPFSRQNILLIEDDRNRSKQRIPKTLKRKTVKSKIFVRMHSIVDGNWKQVVGQTEYSRTNGQNISVQEIALDLLTKTRGRREQIIVAGPSYGGSSVFIRSLMQKDFDFVVEIRPNDRLVCHNFGSDKLSVKPSALIKNARWENFSLVPPLESSPICYTLADLGKVEFMSGREVRLFAAQTGAIEGIHRGTIIGLTSVFNASLDELLKCIGWARWIRTVVRRQERSFQSPGRQLIGQNPGSLGRRLKYRSNITLARLQDASLENSREQLVGNGPRGLLFKNKTNMNIVELFAGAGGMGLGFLLASKKQQHFRLIFSGELNPIYVQSLKRNHRVIANWDRGSWNRYLPESVVSLDLSERKAMERAISSAQDVGEVDILIGGPPCQGFSNANRNSWSSDNPHNSLVNVFLRYVEKIKPPILLMENVQGIAWTSKGGIRSGQCSVSEHVLTRLRKAGYIAFPKLLDAVWYGVPQFRTRLFLMGIRRDIGYTPDEFGEWGPFPYPTHGPGADRPFVTVNDAIGDLPAIGNGFSDDVIEYQYSGKKSNDYLQFLRSHATKNTITDHVTSRHADYVIKRYEQIPAGGNWRDIADMMSNYANVDRTHSNIYRRLTWNDPSITIGHYRKSMLIHPDQHRGLSLREACRLQSFPDWFRFVGTEDGQPGGLMHKQQQLANAVCPLLSKKMAEFIRKF